MSIIFITEKPSVAREYQRVLHVTPKDKVDGYIEGESSVMGTNVIITWAIGHLVSIAAPEKHKAEWKAWRKDTLPIIPDPFLYEANKATYPQFKTVKSLYLRPDVEGIYYAGDSGREGIYIQALIRNQIFKSAPKFPEQVVWIDSFTEESILAGIRDAKPYADYMPMIDSGYARAMDDWLIGINLSRAFTITVGGYGNKIPVGRVMTPTLAMVVKRQEEIDNFKKTPYYGIKADEFASWKAVEGSKYHESPRLYNENGFLDKNDAEAFLRDLEEDKSLTVEEAASQTKTQYAPYLFNLADLQAYCTKAFKISPAETLRIAQTLYEKKYTTYPRTDCRFLSTAVQKDLKTRFGYAVPDRYVNDKKIVDHYAIIPTFEGDAGKLTGLDGRVYAAIYDRFMDTMKPPFIYDTVTVRYIHKNGERLFEKYRIIKQVGFKTAFDENDDDISTKPMPKAGDVVPVKRFHIWDMETKPPAAYTTGSLILAMEKAGRLIEDEELREQIKTCGIGTSATRADIIEKLKKDEYIRTDSKQRVSPTDWGRKIVAIVGKYDESLVSPIKTADMEQQLQAIAESSLTIAEHEERIKEYLMETVKNITKETKEAKIQKICPNCGGVVAIGKYGWYCKDRCGMNISKIFGHELTDEQINDLFDGKSIQYTDGNKAVTAYPDIVENEWNGRTYYNWRTESEVQESEESLVCPHCGGEVTKGKYGWYCKNRCGMSVGKVFGYELTDTQVKKLLTGREIKFTNKGRKTTVLPEVVENEWNDKVYFNWRTE